jgi:hypothetical protein
MSNYDDDYALLGSMDEIIGDDDDELLGLDEIIGAVAATRGKKAAQRLVSKVAAVRQAGGVIVRPKNMSHKGRKVLPMNAAVSLAASASGNGTFLTNELFRPERLVISCTGTSITNDSVDVTAMEIGTSKQFVYSGPVPASVFGAGAFDTAVEFDTINPGIQNNISFTNRDGTNAAVVRAAFLGTSVK